VEIVDRRFIIATYFQWRKSGCRNERLFWATGEEKGLVDKVIDVELQSRIRDSVDFVSLDASEDKLVDVLYTLKQQPHGTNRIVLIRNGNKLKWDKVTPVLSKVYTRIQVIVVSYEAKPVTTEARFRLFIDKGRLVICSKVKEPVKFLMEEENIERRAAERLSARTGGSYCEMNFALQKLRSFDRLITAQMVERYVEEAGQQRFVDSLFSGDGEGAYKSISEVDVEDYGKIFGLIEHKLRQLLVYVPIMWQKLSRQQIASRVGLPVFLVPVFVRHASNVNMIKVKNRVKLLCKVVSLYRKGVVDGILTYMVVRW